MPAPRMLRAVLDTNVLVSGLRSRLGASAALLALVDTGRFQHCLSMPLVCEYEEVLRRERPGIVASRPQEVDDLLDGLCANAVCQRIFYLWRPFLPDPEDDHVLELAVAASADVIVTHNRRDFPGVEAAFGVRVLAPGAFLRMLSDPP